VNATCAAEKPDATFRPPADDDVAKPNVQRAMHLFMAALAILFIVLGFSGFALGGLPTIVFWFLAAVCFTGRVENAYDAAAAA